MKRILVLTSALLVGCADTQPRSYLHDYDAARPRSRLEFNWMPNNLLWQHNVRDCRSQPQCNTAELFRRT